VRCHRNSDDRYWRWRRTICNGGRVRIAM